MVFCDDERRSERFASPKGRGGEGGCFLLVFRIHPSLVVWSNYLDREIVVQRIECSTIESLDKSSFDK